MFAPLKERDGWRASADVSPGHARRCLGSQRRARPRSTAAVALEDVLLSDSRREEVKERQLHPSPGGPRER